ncbi:helix-turn-helix domain-containing protein [Flavobacterium columnare]|uniref:helix-turn-helix domain-containing protein n=1 Tax=Flavobacterium columnare TaxID=996 RepID=UPI004034BC2E
MAENNNNEQWVLLVYLLDEIRKQNGQTMQDVADKAGIIQSHVARFFSAKYKPNLALFLDIAKAVDVNLFFEPKNSKTELNQAFEQAMEKLGRRPDKLPKN